MKIVNTPQIRELDRRAMAEMGIPGHVLMERAGRGVARIAAALCCANGPASRKIVLVAGRGNNGGDAFAAAVFLRSIGYAPEVLLAGEARALRGDALAHFNKMRRSRVPFRELADGQDWLKLTSGPGCGETPAVVVDGVFGTGISGAPRGAAAEAISFINLSGRRSRILSIDVPSGLDSDSGAAAGPVVRADITATMGLPKIGLIQQRALEYVGRLEVIDIGLPDPPAGGAEAGIEFISSADVASIFPARQRISHKGSYGHLLIFAGARGFSGAAVFAALSAARSGAGLVTVVAPESVAGQIAAAVPEAMVHGAPETGLGSLSRNCWTRWRRELGRFTAILAGPGMTQHPATRALVESILRESRVPVALDADALNVYAGRAARLGERKCPLVITPHPGEMARLLGIAVEAIQADRHAAALKACRLSRAVTILKGAGTLVAARNLPLQVNMNGNPGMATGGTGDALAGLLGGLLARGLAPFDAARAAVFLHGRAGDLAAAVKTQEAMTARDLADALPQAFAETLRR